MKKKMRLFDRKVAAELTKIARDAVDLAFDLHMETRAKRDPHMLLIEAISMISSSKMAEFQLEEYLKSLDEKPPKK